MLLFLRKFLFYFLTILYLIVTPYAVLYALGYLFNPVAGELVKTGLVSIISHPKNAAVYIEGKRFAQKTPTEVRELLPGNYQVRVMRKGHQTWEKKITIEPEKAVQLEPILLLPDRPAYEVVSGRPFKDFLPGVLEFKIFAWESESLSSLVKIDLFFKKEAPLSREVPIAGDLKISEVLYQEKSPMALVKVRSQKGKNRYLILEPGEEKKLMTRVQEDFPEDPDWIDWDPKDASQIYFLKDGSLSLMDLRRNRFHAGMMQDVLGFGVRQNRLYVLQKDYSLMEVRRALGVIDFLVLESGMLGRKIFGGVHAKFFKIEVMDRDLILFLSNEGALISNRLPYHLVDDGVLGIRRAQAAEENKVLFWTEEAVGVIDFTKGKEEFFEKEPAKRILYDKGEDIRHASWAYDDSHILFLDGDEVFLLEAKGPAPYFAQRIEKVKRDTPVYYQERDHSLYYLDPASGHLIKRKLID